MAAQCERDADGDIKMLSEHEVTSSETETSETSVFECDISTEDEESLEETMKSIRLRKAAQKLAQSNPLLLSRAKRTSHLWECMTERFRKGEDEYADYFDEVKRCNEVLEDARADLEKANRRMKDAQATLEEAEKKRIHCNRVLEGVDQRREDLRRRMVISVAKCGEATMQMSAVVVGLEYTSLDQFDAQNAQNIVAF
ncbi:hypothetical protein DFP72DRAFT_851998 [Ephemerocybe angulata]|uniref:Uncharacterized protein n=1 Tax=Ephemerocybe angulata TaxID=980116 RepID=A0A8H6HP01_9AGAR|nr:hypothetical protein DFP72DRAFT_851998 [Tulosesus angulatus]